MSQTSTVVKMNLFRVFEYMEIPAFLHVMKYMYVEYTKIGGKEDTNKCYSRNILL